MSPNLAKYRTDLITRTQRSVRAARIADERTAALRRAIADYMRFEGCSCCRNQDSQDDAKRRIAGLLDVPMYSDGSGYDFNQFATDPVNID